MKKISAVLLLALVGSGCVTAKTNRRDVLEAYRKGLKVGRVIGRDQVLGELKSPDCFTQTANELMNEDKEGNK